MKVGEFEFKFEVLDTVRLHTRLAIRVRKAGTETYALCGFVTMRNEEALAFTTIEEKLFRLESLDD